MCAPPTWPSFQIDTVPSSLRQRMSLCPLASKSPVPATCQLVGTGPGPTPGPATKCPAVTLPSFQMDTEPSSLRQRMSLWPLPSKSPVPEMCQEFGMTPEPEMMWEPSSWPSSQMDAAPLSLRHTMSLWPSPPKSLSGLRTKWSRVGVIVSLKVSVPVSEPSLAVTLRSSAPLKLSGGVPEKVRVETLKLSQLGKAEPLLKLAL